MIEPFQGFRDLIRTIPGIGPLTADVIVAETGADMTRFPTAGHLASWAGTSPGHNESAGRVKSTKTRPGNPYLQGALGAAAMSLRPDTRHLPRRPVPADRLAPRTAESQRRDPTLDAHRDLAHGPRPAPSTTTPAPTTSPAYTRARQEPRTPPARGNGLPSHSRPRRVTTPALPRRESSRQRASLESCGARRERRSSVRFRQAAPRHLS